MSNCPGNDMMESFFVFTTFEIFYSYEKAFRSLNQLKQSILDYIDYYNKRIKVKLKELNPVLHRTKSFTYIICPILWDQYKEPDFYR